jgi:2-polyprenyl-6-methoxyphenol hydroxylase-like FAD-dependent oxidoreductase
MTNPEVDTDILIVGAGPVGLFLANECARRGLRWRLIEERPSQSQYSKALAIFPRTLEIFDMAGLVAAFLQTANPVTKVTILTHDRKLAHMHFTPEGTPYSFVAMVPQDVTEKLLVDALRQKGGDVGYETKFVSGEQHDEGQHDKEQHDKEQHANYVEAVLDHQGESIRLKASFVIGCDGARSAVRQMVKLPLEGGEYAPSFMLADIEADTTFPVDEMQLCPSEFGPVAIFPMSASRRRIVATVDQVEGDAPSLDLVKRVLAQRAPIGIEARSLHWSSYFRIHHRHAARLRVGRVFIAGDAAHIHSPFGGQGMNTGLHDVWNLVWKLDLFLHGHGNQELLDSYSAERIPVIKNVIETTDLMTKVLGTPNKLAQALRDAVIPMVSRLAPFEHAFVNRLSELGIAYRGSPIVEGPGKRYFEDSLRGGAGIRNRFLLLLNAAADPSTKAAAEQLARSLSDVVEFRQTQHEGITLVRPDGYIGYSAHISSAHPDSAHSGSAHPDNNDAALKSVRSLLERQTKTAASGPSSSEPSPSERAA